MALINSNKSFKHFLNDYFNNLRSKGEVIRPSSQYFGQIGSIPLEDISYSNQLEGKLATLKELFKEYLSSEQLETYAIKESPLTYGYRFKMDYVCSFNPFEDPNNKFGQRQKKRFNRVVDMTSCTLIPEDIFINVRKVYDFFRESNVQNYDLVKHIGNLRYLTVKQFKDSERDVFQSMLIIISKDNSDEEIFNKAAQFALSLGFKSIYWLLNPTITDTSEGEIYRQWGDTTIEVKVNELRFKVGPNTFFQNNIFLFEDLLKYLDSYLNVNINKDNEELKKDTELYDLYSGVGIIGASLSTKFSKVICIDINSENIQLAKESNELNNIKNIEFIEGDLNIDLNKLSLIYNNKLNIQDTIDRIKTNQTVVVDPPRTGLQKNGIEIIKKLLPQTLIYISCNPVTQAQDYEQLKDLYEIKEIKGFDMFPHTLHVENLMILEKKMN